MFNSILILTECGTEIGFGHLTRCLSLAQAFREAGMSAQVWVAADTMVRDRLPKSVSLVHWYGISDGIDLEITQASAVVVDSFIIDVEQVERISQMNPRVAVIDDFPRRHYKTGIVIDWTIGAEHFAFPEKHPGVVYLLGSRYCALRPEFRTAEERVYGDSPRSLLMSLGGADVRSLTGPILAMLQSEFPALHKHVVIGAGFRDTSFRNRMPDPGNTTFYEAPDGTQMKTLMARSDIAVCGGGQTLYELASQSLPPAVVSMVNNQEDDIRGFVQVGFATSCGAWHRSDLLPILAADLRAFWPASVRIRHASAGRRCVDGRGAERLVAALLEQWEGYRHAHG